MGDAARREVPLPSLRVLLAAGLGGVCVDLDHLVWGARAWHGEAFVVAVVCLLVGCAVACDGG